MNEGGQPGKKNGNVRAIWLCLAKGGGRWTPDEVAEAVNHPRKWVAQAMHNMTLRQGQLTRYKGAGGRCSFGVTAECIIPVGITVRDLADAGVMGGQP